MTGFPDLSAELDLGLAAMELPLSASIRDGLLAYLALLARWNSTYNLSAVRNPGEMLIRHVFDSLAALPHVRGGRLADVGTGAGLPGIPMALARPDWRVLLIDSNGKKTRFLREAVRMLEMADRCEVVQTRAETLVHAQGYDTVTSRAFASLTEFIETSRGLLAPGGRWLAMKGRRPDEEIAALPPDIRVEAVLPLVVPGLAGERHAVIMTGPSQGS